MNRGSSRLARILAASVMRELMHPNWLKVKWQDVMVERGLVPDE